MTEGVSSRVELKFCEISRRGMLGPSVSGVTCFVQALFSSFSSSFFFLYSFINQKIWAKNQNGGGNCDAKS